MDAEVCGSHVYCWLVDAHTRVVGRQTDTV